MEMEKVDDVSKKVDVGSENHEMDLPPEYCHYRDEGCELADACLKCPFARCIYDESGGKQRWLKRLRAREMARLFTQGKKVKELALMFGVSQRTVQRALKTLGDAIGLASNVIPRNEVTKNPFSEEDSADSSLRSE